jgi:hypothetical protein
LRQSFFGSWDKPIVPLVVPQAQSGTWQSDYYRCKESAIASARLDRHETYDPNFLRWHWRLAAEQLLYSHQTTVSPANASASDPYTGRPRFLSNTKPMLLACGTEDHVAFNDICPATQATAPNMTATPGRAIFLQQTGHSVDNERRSYFAQQVAEFLGYLPSSLLPLNAPCSDDARCESNRCDGAISHRCIPMDGTGLQGEFCSHDHQCANGSCVGSQCATPRAPGAPCASNQSCLSGRCDNANGNPHACIPNDNTGNPGDYCTSPNQCNPRVCVTCDRHACVGRR